MRLRRELQTVAVPVFQFGIFGEKTLAFHAGPNFDFGGRVHTNQTLYLAAGTGSTLTFRDKITAFVEVVRNTLSNGRSITLTNHTGTVSIPKVIGGVPADYRNLAGTEGSGTTAAPWAGWKNLSEVTYHTNIRTETTGAKQLNLPLVSRGRDPDRPDTTSRCCRTRTPRIHSSTGSATSRRPACASCCRIAPPTSPTCRRSRRVRRLT